MHVTVYSSNNQVAVIINALYIHGSPVLLISNAKCMIPVYLYTEYSFCFVVLVICTISQRK